MKTYETFQDWLKEITRYSKENEYIQQVYSIMEEGGITWSSEVRLYTHDYCYSIRAMYKKAAIKVNDDSYICCSVTKRKAHAGEDWFRGRDLRDGEFCEETWQAIKDAIIANELVRVVKKSRLKEPIKENTSPIQNIGECKNEVQ